MGFLTQIPWLDYLEQLQALVNRHGYAKVLATGAGAFAAYKLLYALYLSPLRNIPGPFLARLTSKRAGYLGAKGLQAHKAVVEYEQYGDIYVYEPKAVVLCNPKDIRTVCSSHRFRKAEFFKVLDMLGVENTLSTRDPHFSAMRRRQIGPYFNNVYLGKMEKSILQYGILAIKEKWDGLLRQSDKGFIEVNYHRHFMFATFDTIGNLAFGKDFGALANDDPTVSKWLNAILAYLSTQAVLPLTKWYPFSLVLTSVGRLYADFISYAAQCIDTRRRLLSDLESKGGLDSSKPNDLLQAFLECEDPESKVKMTSTEVHAESLLMLVAGSETSSNTLLWTTHLLMLYPECYKKAVEEVRTAFDKDHLITYSEAKAQLPYLEACIYESMRLAPVTGGHTRRVAPKEGAMVGGHYIPGGYEVNLNISAANLNKDYWQTPYLYDPTRFLSNDDAKRSIFTFGVGVRVCPGRQLAWVELLTILANILKDYDLRLPDDYKHRGPHVLDERGYPKLLDSLNFFVNVPADSDRDCRILVSKRQ